MAKPKSKRQPSAKARRAVRDDSAVSYGVPTKDLHQASFIAPPLLCTHEDDGHQARGLVLAPANGNITARHVFDAAKMH